MSGPVGKATPSPIYSAPMTNLQKHVAFFDENKDGKVVIDELLDRAEKLGMGWFSRQIVGRITMLELGKDGVIDIATIGKFGGQGSAVFDKAGNFDKAAFAKMFDDFDKNKDGKLSKSETDTMCEERGGGFKGELRLSIAYGLLHDLAADSTDGDETAITSSRLSSLFTGDLFFDMVNEPRLK
jgi:hypothetical protein